MPPAPHPLEPDEHRRARHLFTLKCLTERGYTLAMKAADKAEADLDAPAPEPDDTPPPSAHNPHQTFERYVRVVRLLVNVEHRIAHPTAPKRIYRAHGPDADPRRPKLHHFLDRATRNSPDRAALRRAAVASLDQALDSDPARTLAPAKIFHEICQEYGLPFDLAHLPDEFLEPPRTGPPNTAETCAHPR